MTSATERIRALLDERGVKWMPVAWNPKRETFYHTSNGVGFCADEYADGVKIYTDATITPEQAIAATLGATDAKPTQAESPGTCHVECFDDGIDEALDGSPIYTTPTWYLSCGHTCEGAERPSFCPNCGTKVVEPTTNDVDAEVEQ